MPDEHFSTPGGIRYSPASPYAQELAKWERQPREDGSVTQSMINEARRIGLHHGVFDTRPDGSMGSEYPRAMYKAEQTANGIKIIDMATSAHSDDDRERLEGLGYRASQAEAIEVVEARNTEIAKLAANRAYNDRRMSAAAQAEAEAADNATARHLAEIPAERLPAKRGRPRKVVTTQEG